MASEASHRDRCAVVGIGCTDYSRNSGRSDLTLAVQATLAACADAGLDPSAIDGIVASDMDTVRSNDLAPALGIPEITFTAQTGPGGTAPPAMMPGPYCPTFVNPRSIWPPIATAPLRLPIHTRGPA